MCHETTPFARCAQARHGLARVWTVLEPLQHDHQRRSTKCERDSGRGVAYARPAIIFTHSCGVLPLVHTAHMGLLRDQASAVRNCTWRLTQSFQIPSSVCCVIRLSSHDGACAVISCSPLQDQCLTSSPVMITRSLLRWTPWIDSTALPYGLCALGYHQCGHHLLHFSPRIQRMFSRSLQHNIADADKNYGRSYDLSCTTLGSLLA